MIMEKSYEHRVDANCSFLDNEDGAMGRHQIAFVVPPVLFIGCNTLWTVYISSQCMA